MYIFLFLICSFLSFVLSFAISFFLTIFLYANLYGYISLFLMILPCYLYKIVAQNVLRTYEFKWVFGIGLFQGNQIALTYRNT